MLVLFMLPIYQNFISEMLPRMMIKGYNSSISSTSSYMLDFENICIRRFSFYFILGQQNYKIP